MAVKDFYEWCKENNLDLSFESTHKEPVRGMKKFPNKNKFNSSRDQCDDLSADHKGHVAMNGTVEPYNVDSEDKDGKDVAPVAS
jgi:hypothetical protein